LARRCPVIRKGVYAHRPAGGQGKYVPVTTESTRPGVALLARCPRCGGQVALRDGAIFLDCPYCDSALYVEAHALYPRTVLLPVLKGWYEASARIEEWANEEHGRWGIKAMREVMQELPRAEMQYFPVWVLHTEAGDVHVEPAAVTAASEMWKLNVETGQIVDALPQGKELPMPEVPRQVALAWAARRGVDASAIAEISLTYVPVYILHCEHEGELFTVVVEASSGRVMADYPPPTLGLSWQTISYLSYGAFMVAGITSGVLQVAGALVLLLLFELAGGLSRDLFPFYDLGLFSAFMLRYIVNILIWLATMSGLVMVFSGRWKPFRSRRGVHGKK
jgi:uncharacterized C2H2 Zn-finger protein